MASYITLELNGISAKHLENVRSISKMKPYAVVSISGDHTITKQELMTQKDPSGGSNPTWNTPFAFTVNESLAKQDRLRLKFQIKRDGLAFDKTIGEVIVQIKELLDSSSSSTSAEAKSMKSVTYQVWKSGKRKGELHFSYKFRDAKADEPAIANPAPMSTGSSSAPNAYPPPPQPGYGYPPPQPQGAAPYATYLPLLQHQLGYGDLPPPPQHGHGYFYTCTVVNMFLRESATVQHTVSNSLLQHEPLNEDGGKK